MSSGNVEGAAERLLPPDWSEQKTEDGKVYYFNTSSGQSMWTPPSAAVAVAFCLVVIFVTVHLVRGKALGRLSRMLLCPLAG